jgi:hypothetical protein
MSVKKGELKDKFIHMDFSAKNDEQALMFAKGAYELKTFKGNPIEFGAYILRKRHHIVYWKVLKYVDPKVQGSPGFN